MITKYELSQVDIKIALAEYIAKKLGKDPAQITAETTISVQKSYDFMDRPTGGYTVIATVTVK